MATQNETVDEYLARNHVLTYLQDAVEQLLEYKEDNPKVVTSRFFHDYFTSVKEGNHILFRDYQFVQSTPHNRGSFINLVLRCFRHIGKRGDLLTIAEYNSLIKLLCADFPFPIVQKTAIIILMEDATDCVVSFSDFMYAFQIQFYYEEFLQKCEEVYKTLLRSPPQETVVVVPTSEPPAPHGNPRNDSPNNDTVDSVHLYKLLCPIIEKASYSCPSMSAVHALLSASSRVSYYGLLMAMAKSDEINKEIGILPSRNDLYEGLDDQPELILNKPAEKPPVESRSSSCSLTATSATTVRTVNHDADKTANGNAASRPRDKPEVGAKREGKKRRGVRPKSSSGDSSSSSDSSDD